MRYWRITPWTPSDETVFASAWAYDLGNNTISIGWREMGDVSKLIHDDAAMGRAFRSAYPTKSPNSERIVCDLFRRFYGMGKGVNVGDQIMACRGKWEIIGVGTVAGSPYYDAEQGRRRIKNMGGHLGGNSHFLPVEWEKRDRLRVPVDVTFPRITLSEMSGEKFQYLLANSTKLA